MSGIFQTADRRFPGRGFNTLTVKRLVLFDIDGTLLTTGGAPRRAISRALREIFQIDDGLDGLSRSSFAGKTDPEIILAILARNSYPLEKMDDSLSLFFKRYTEALKEELPGETRARLHPGLKELLQSLKSSGKAFLSLLTGNIREGAQIKLDHFGLAPFFSSGSFGSDSRDRGDLPAIAVRRVFELTGQRFKDKDVVIIGDTFDDLKVSRLFGAKAILVATGFYPYDELARAGPDCLFRDFSDTPKVVEAILS